MAKAPTLDDVTNLANTTSAQATINTNSDRIETSFENTLSLDGSTPNSMTADIDLNSNDLLNGGIVNATTLKIGGTIVTTTALTATDASEIDYDQGGTGSVATNVEAKLQERISVKDFGAVGDGVVDDTAAIQAAITHIDTLVTANNKFAAALYFPSGQYNITATLNIDFIGLTIYGDGPKASLIIPDESTTFNVFTGNFVNGTSVRLQMQDISIWPRNGYYAIKNIGGTMLDCKFLRVWLSGKPATDAGGGLRGRGFNGVATNTIFTDCIFELLDIGVDLSANSSEVNFDNCIFYKNYGYSLKLSGSSGNEIRGVYIGNGCRFEAGEQDNATSTFNYDVYAEYVDKLQIGTVSHSDDQVTKTAEQAYHIRYCDHVQIDEVMIEDYNTGTKNFRVLDCTQVQVDKVSVKNGGTTIPVEFNNNTDLQTGMVSVENNDIGTTGVYFVNNGNAQIGKVRVHNIGGTNGIGIDINGCTYSTFESLYSKDTEAEGIKITGSDMHVLNFHIQNPNLSAGAFRGLKLTGSGARVKIKNGRVLGNSAVDYCIDVDTGQANNDLVDIYCTGATSADVLDNGTTTTQVRVA